MNLSPNEKTLLNELIGRNIIQCLANCKELGSFFPTTLGGVRITKGLIGGLEAKGLLLAELCLESSIRQVCFRLSDFGKVIIERSASNG